MSNEELEDFQDLLALRQGKADSQNQKARPLNEVAAELGLDRKS